VPDDEREGDDLFEDLDKFFAPIKEVDWDEPEEAAPAAEVEEEHVSVRGQPEPAVTVPASGEEPEPAAGELDDEDEGDWYDTASLEPVGQALGGTAEPEELDEGSGVAGPAQMAPDADVDEGSLFAAPADEGEWPLADEDEVADRPSDEELEEAAAHFAEPGETDAQPRVVQIDEESAGDLLDELGAEPYPADEEDEEDEFAAMAEGSRPAR
jgi:hypothetical protein